MSNVYKCVATELFMKVCKHCNNNFIETHFNQKYCSNTCSEEIKRINRDKYKQTEKGILSRQRWVNSEKRKENEKSYRQKEEYKLKNKLRVQKYYNKNKTDEEFIQNKREINKKYIESNYNKVRELNSIATKKYSLTERGKQSRRNAKSIRRTRENTGNVTLKQWKNILNKYNNSCAFCGSTKNIEQDHIIPLSKGGLHNINNIQPLCRSCNARKSNKVLE